MATGIAVTGERQKPTPERFAGGRLRPPNADRGDDSPAPPETKKGCLVCGTIQRGDAFTSLPDEKGIGRVVHVPINSEGGQAVSRNLGCLGTFVSGVETAAKRKVLEEKQDLALEALRREGNLPRLEPSSQRHFDCPAPDCSRFFDSQNGVDLHRRRQHRGAA